jgi:hypothetical protein
MRKMIIIITIAAGLLASAAADTGLKYNGLNSLLLAQGDEPAVETEGATPRIKSKKKAEYRDGKSPLLAAGLSLAVPGAGEFYGGDYLRSGIFFGIEAFMLSMWYYYESDGDDKRDEFRSYADRFFDEDLYYGGLLGMTQNFKHYMEIEMPWRDASLYWNYEYFSNRDEWEHITPPGGVPDSLGVHDFLTLSFKDPFNSAPYALVSLAGGSSQFTHNLPETKTQQYYEMIGKYHQFSCGWNDFDGYEYNEDGSVMMETKYVRNAEGENVEVVIPKFKSGIFDYSENGYRSARVDIYEVMRDDANKAYEMGQNFLMITLVNHVASAFDASYVIKSRYQIDTQLRLENTDKADNLGFDNYKLTYAVRW